ncbi:MAG: FAD-dependent monooxygenase [Microbacteriaceae bacterium]
MTFERSDADVDTDVLVVGAGPVGQTLAIALAQRDVRVHLVERKDRPAFLPKMERCNARTMEIFRRLGLHDKVRAATKFVDVPMDVFIVSSLTAPPILRLEYPSVREAMEQTLACHDASMPREPYQLISQYTLEPLLKSVVEQLPAATVQFGCELVSFEQDDAGVTSVLRAADGAERSVRSRYLVGCDGGSSGVRKALGIPLQGRGRIAAVHQLFFRAPGLFDRIAPGKGRHYYGPKGALVVQDDLEHFMLNIHQLVEGRSPADEIRAFIGMDLEVEVLHVSSWWQHLLVAERYRDGQVFLAGDSNHLYIPTGGLGMNTGAGDAVDLAWKLAAVIAGWGGPDLLASFEAERRPVGLRNCDAAGMAASALRAWRAFCPPELADDTPQGAEARRAVAEAANEHQRVVHEMINTELGYRYADSPIVCADPDPVPDPGPMTYEPTTTCGIRLPHVWLTPGDSVHDHIGDGFTLLRLGGAAADTSALEAAMIATGAPFAVLTIDDARVRRLYERDLILVRPDLHVVWRGDAPPDNPEEVARVVTGHADRSRTPVAALAVHDQT